MDSVYLALSGLPLNSFSMSDASCIKAFMRESPPSPQFRSGVVSPASSMVRTVPNEALFKQLCRGN